MTNTNKTSTPAHFRAYEVTPSSGPAFRVHNMWEAIGHCDGDPQATYKRIDVTRTEWEAIPS